MAFQNTGLVPLGDGGSYRSTGIGGGDASQVRGVPVMWRYVTEDTLANIRAANYFNDASARLQVGDVIFATTEASKASFVSSIVYVRSISDAGVVVLSNATTIPRT